MSFSTRQMLGGVLLVTATVLLHWMFSYRLDLTKDNKRPLRLGGAVQEYAAVEEPNYLIPNDTVLTSMTEEELAAMVWRYIHSVQVLCKNQVRLGKVKDGGKEVCVDHDYIPSAPCLAYSFGSNYNADYELAIVDNFGCEVYTFDPSIVLKKTDKIPEPINFYYIGLSDQDGYNEKNWKMKTLQSIMNMLNHTGQTIDLLKIDIESAEYSVIPNIISSGVYKQVKQLNVEFHFMEWNTHGHLQALDVLRMLYDNGFYIFMRERNLACISDIFIKKNIHPTVTLCNELSFVNICYRKRC